MNKQTFLAYFKASSQDWNDWHWQIKNRITKIDALVRMTGKIHLRAQALKNMTSSYPMAVTPYYLSLMQDTNDNDPIYLQSIPRLLETAHAESLPEDPLQEEEHMPVPKLVRRYSNRCLIMVTEQCAVFCRHCNRKRFWAHPQPINFKTGFQKMIAYLAQTPSVREVILSGGDPLTLEDLPLEKILSSLKAIRHIEILRIGSRMPVVLPMRITPDFCRMLKRYRPIWFNTQFNHPSEITPEATRACNMIQETGIPVSNQSVLLKGVNDSLEVMKNLLHGLQKISVRPYYLFHCDPVKGCAHFRTSLQKGIALMEELWAQCSGLAFPQYVVDLPGKAGKIPLIMRSRSLHQSLKKHKHFFDKFPEID